MDGLAGETVHDGLAQRRPSVVADEREVRLGKQREPHGGLAAVSQRFAGRLAEGHGMVENLPIASPLPAGELAVALQVSRERLGRGRWQTIVFLKVRRQQAQGGLG